MRCAQLLFSALVLVPAAVHAQNAPVVPEPRKSAPDPGSAELFRLRAMTARFAPAVISADIAALPESERKALAKIVEASREMDAIFLRQSWAGNPSMLVQLSGDETPLGRARLRYFVLNKGPWSSLDQNEPFITGVGPKPPSANF